MQVCLNCLCSCSIHVHDKLRSVLLDLDTLTSSKSSLSAFTEIKVLRAISRLEVSPEQTSLDPVVTVAFFTAILMSLDICQLRRSKDFSIFSYRLFRSRFYRLVVSLISASYLIERYSSFKFSDNSLKFYFEHFSFKTSSNLLIISPKCAMSLLCSTMFTSCFAISGTILVYKFLNSLYSAQCLKWSLKNAVSSLVAFFESSSFKALMSIYVFFISFSCFVNLADFSLWSMSIQFSLSPSDSAIRSLSRLQADMSIFKLTLSVSYSKNLSVNFTVSPFLQKSNKK